LIDLKTLVVDKFENFAGRSLIKLKSLKVSPW